MLLKHTNLQRKNDTQQEEGGEEMLPHYTPKPHSKWKKQEFKRIYIMSKFEPKLKVVYLSSINSSTYPLTPMLIVITFVAPHGYGSS